MTDTANYEAKRTIMNQLIESDITLVRNVCGALGCTDKAVIDGLIGKYVYKDLKMKKRKDVNAPKKALTSYQIWGKDVRTTLAKANPTWDMPTMSKKMGEMWNKMTEDDKKPFVAKAEADKVRYADEKQKYDALICSQTTEWQGTGSQNAMTVATSSE